MCCFLKKYLSIIAQSETLSSSWEVCTAVKFSCVGGSETLVTAMRWLYDSRPGNSEGYGSVWFPMGFISRSAQLLDRDVQL